MFLWPLTYLDGKMAKKKKKSLLSISDIGNGSSPDYKNRPVKSHTSSVMWVGFFFFLFLIPLATNHSLGFDTVLFFLKHI